MGFTLAQLHWKPNDFWAATPHEVMSAVEYLNYLNPDTEE